MIGTSMLFLLGLGFVAATILAIASKLLYVKEDPRIALVEDALPGANCGGCGYPGCNGAANAVVAGKSGSDVCVIGGQETVEKVAAVMGLEVVLREPELAFHDCTGGLRAVERFKYEGAHDCRAQSLLFGGTKACSSGCLGLGTCVEACPFDAMYMGKDGYPKIYEDKCVACGTCAEVCPRDVLSIVSMPARLLHMNTTNECLAPCRQICPAQINIPQYIEEVEKGQYREAIITLKERNPLILSIGRVCPAPCEGGCRRGLVDDPVGINYVKRFVADWEMENGRIDLPCARDTGKKVAVIGGGPAGLSAAYFLRRLGHAVTIYDMHPKLGGQLRYGIPEYRLPKHILDWEIDNTILALGVDVKTNMNFGTDFTLDQLRREGFEAFFMGIGAWLNHNLRIDGEDAKGVLGGTEYLTAVALGQNFEHGKKVIIVGGGNTAMDAARTAKRMGAQVTVMYRRTRDAMPALPIEIEAAEEEMIDFVYLAGPTKVVQQDGRAVGLEYVKMQLGEPDSSGRRRPEVIEGSESFIECDMIVAAIGQYPDTCYIEDMGDSCKLTRWKTIDVNPDSMQSTVPDVFAAGDLVSGPDLVVTAIGGARRAARGIHYYLMQDEIPIPKDLLREPIPESLFKELPGVGKRPRAHVPEICVEDRDCNFKEVEHTLSPTDAKLEAARCMRCGRLCYNPDFETIKSQEEYQREQKQV